MDGSTSDKAKIRIPSQKSKRFMLMMAVLAIMASGFVLLSSDDGFENVSADTGNGFQEGDYYYTVVGDGKVEISNYVAGLTKYSQFTDTVTHDGKEYTVVGIGDKAFKNFSPNKKWTFSLPEACTYIGTEAFLAARFNCDVNIPDSVTSIGADAFNSVSCNNIYVGKGVTSIEGHTFRSVSVSGYIYIGDNVETIGVHAFDSVKTTTVIFNDKLKEIGKCAFSEAGINGSLVLPESVETIGPRAFEDCYYVSLFYLGENVKEISSMAFFNVHPVTFVIASKDTEIDESAFNEVEFYDENGNLLKNTKENLSGHTFSKVDGKLTRDVVPPKYKLTVKANHDYWGTVSGGGEFYYGQSTIVYAEPKEGFKLESWSDGSVLEVHKVTVEKDEELIAYFKEIKCVLYFDEDGGSEHVPSIEKQIGTTITLPEYPGTREGYAFKGWSINSIPYQPGDEYTLTKPNETATAIWTEVKCCTVTYDTNGGTPEWGSEKVVYLGCYEVPMYDGEKPGYTFQYWVDKDTKVRYTPRDIVYVTGDSTLIAQWKDNREHEARFATAGGDLPAPNPIKALEGEEYALPNYDGKKAGFYFAGWLLKGVTYPAGAKFTMGTEDVIYAAHWIENGYHLVTYDVDGGDRQYAYEHVKEGAEFTLGTYDGKKSGYAFDHWRINDKDYNVGDKVTMGNKDVVVKVIWRQLTEHTASFDVGEGSEPAPASITVLEGKKFELPEYNGTIEGKHFDGWTYEGKTYDVKSKVTMINGDMKFVIKWIDNPTHRVSFNVDGGSIELPTETVTEGVTYTIPGYGGTRAGFTFIGWELNGTTYKAGDKLVAGNKDVTLEAVWKENEKHTVSFDVGKGSEKAPESFTVPEGGIFKLPSYAGKIEGMHFAGWIYNDKTYMKGDSVTMGDADMKFVAKWSDNPTHKVSFDVDGGSVEIESTEVTEGVTYIVPGYDGIKAGSTFVGWELNGKTYKAGETLVAGNKDVTLKAVWKENEKHTASFDVGKGSEKAPASITLSEGLQFVLPSYKGAVEGKHFGGWSYNGATYEAGSSMVMAAKDIKFVAVWIDNPTHKVSFNVDGGSIELPTEIVTEGVTYIVPGYEGTRTGFTFVGWELNGTTYKAGEKLVAGDKDVILKAVWKENEKHTASFDIGKGTEKAPASITKRAGEAFTLPYYKGAPDWYIFVGWEYDGKILAAGTSLVMADSDMKFVAHYTELKMHRISYDVDGGSVQLPDQLAYEGMQYTIEEYTGVKAGYTFAGWSCNGVMHQPGDVVTMGKIDVLMKVVWKAKTTYYASFDVGEGSEPAPEEIEIYEGLEFKLPSYSGKVEGLHFGGWAYNGNVYAPGAIMKAVASDMEFVAVWNENPSHRIIYNVNGGDVKYPSEMAVEGKVFKFSAYEGKREGYEFACWETSENARYYPGDIATMGKSDIIVSVIWKEAAKPVQDNTLAYAGIALVAILLISALAVFLIRKR